MAKVIIKCRVCNKNHRVYKQWKDYYGNICINCQADEEDFIAEYLWKLKHEWQS